MTDRPIIFSAPMVRALLAGRKTQTRRLATSPLRRIEVGDRLYVREHWRSMKLHDGLSPTKLARRYQFSVYGRAYAAPIKYLADDMLRGEWPDERSGGWMPGKHRQGMHMPRWASRLTLIVEDVRVERLQAISDDDAWAEGVCHAIEDGQRSKFGDVGEDERRAIVRHVIGSGRNAFHWLWDNLHDKSGERWEDNPAIVALTFRVIHSNIDRIAA